jgi:hypothetical protein
MRTAHVAALATVGLLSTFCLPSAQEEKLDPKTRTQ